MIIRFWLEKRWTIIRLGLIFAYTQIAVAAAKTFGDALFCFIAWLFVEGVLVLVKKRLP